MNRWRIFGIGRTDVCLHPSLILYLIYGILTGHAAFMLITMASIILHEGAHAIAAFMFGQPPWCIELTPLGAVMRLEDENRLPTLKRALMLAAGPLMTLLLCGLSVRLSSISILPLPWGQLIFQANLCILLLNLLPALPLDGGRMLSLLLGMFMTPLIVGKIMRIAGSCLGISMIALNIYTSLKLGGWNLSLAFVGCCLIYSASVASLTQAMTELRWFMDRKIRLERGGRCRSALLCVLHTQCLSKLLRKLPARKAAVFVCMEAGSMRCLGWLTEYEAVQLYLQQPEINLAEAVRLSSAQTKNNQAQYEK